MQVRFSATSNSPTRVSTGYRIYFLLVAVLIVAVLILMI
jgi:hypothetical protein